MNPLNAAYGTAARLRRRYYEHHPSARRHLGHPVISIGNLVVGGSGKTPVVACLAAMLRDMGERPAVLSRGYARRSPLHAVVIVSDGTKVREPVSRSGDEPQLLARALPGVPVIVSGDRHAAGLEAERQFGCTVSVLDDGFQHLRLVRDIDLLLVRADDLDARLLPFGVLREPIDVARAADALLVAGDAAEARTLRARLAVPTSFTVTARFETPRHVVPFGQRVSGVEGCSTFGEPTKVVAVAAIARPERFFATVRRQGWTVATEIAFRDHHWFTREDVARVSTTALRAGAGMVLTTEKDAVRLDGLVTGEGIPWGYVPMQVGIEPCDTFRAWIADRLTEARHA